MMGSGEPQKGLWSYRVNLDKRVRSDHPLRKLNDVLKLEFVREEVVKTRFNRDVPVVTALRSFESSSDQMISGLSLCPTFGRELAGSTRLRQN